MKVPWARLYIDEDELKSVIDTVKSGWLSMGPKVRELEERMADYIGVKYAVAVNSGTAALDVALKVLDIGQGDEVIVPAMSYIATANAVLYQHATPVFADINSRTFNIDSLDIEKKITSKTKCIIPIDYGGQAADFSDIIKVASKKSIFVVEDGAPGLSGTYKGKKLCSFGNISTTSFHIAKNFTTIEGGMIFTNNSEYAEKAIIIRSQGENKLKKYNHILLGHNYRMTDINAAIGLVQISRIDAVLRSRRKAAEYYISHLHDYTDIVMPFVRPECEHAWFLFPVLVNNRDKVREYLLEKGVGTNISWPMPIYEQKIYKKFKTKTCPVSEKITKKILCLPMFFNITKKEQDYVIKHLVNAVKQFT